MNPENVVEAFVSTMIIGVLLVIAIYLLNPDIGQSLIGILPTFIEWMSYGLIVVILAAIIYQLVDSF